MMNDRNPSPPPENMSMISDDNCIGSTLFTKCAVLRIVHSLVQEVRIDDQFSEEPTELQQSLNDDLCQLWDMTTDREVAIYLIDIDDIMRLFLEVVKVTNKPRLTELLSGILANLACEKDVCLPKMAKSSELRELTFRLFGCRDTPTLIEITRFLARISNLDTECWTSEWQCDFEFFGFDNLCFILSSTLNADLLQQSAVITLNLTLNDYDFAGDRRDELVNSVVLAGHDGVHTDTMAHLVAILTLLDDHCPIADALLLDALSWTRSIINSLSVRSDIPELTRQQLAMLNNTYNLMDRNDRFLLLPDRQRFLMKSKSAIGILIETVDEEIRQQCLQCLAKIDSFILSGKR